MDRINVVAGIIHRKGTVLLARRKAGGHLAGYWEFPGGKVESGETPERALARELKEELSILVEVGSLVAESCYDYGPQRIRLLGYFAKYLAGDFALESHDKIEWVPVGKVESFKLAPADVPLIRALEKIILT